MTSQFLYSCLDVSEDRAGQDRLQPTVTQQTINGYTQSIATLIQMRNTANHWGSFYQWDSLGLEWMDDFWPQGYFPMSVFKSHSGWLPEKNKTKQVLPHSSGAPGSCSHAGLLCSIFLFLPFYVPSWIPYVLSGAQSKEPSGHFAMMYSPEEVQRRGTCNT